ncbi:MAG: hypothetical protein CSA66_04280, partial [Proteobacteria bacterium]
LDVDVDAPDTATPDVEAPDTAAPDTASPDAAADATGQGDAIATDTGGGDSVGPACPGGFGCACAGGDGCDSELCVEGPDGFICSRTCIASCPDGFECLTISSSGGDPISACIPQHVRLCRPCRDHDDCQVDGDPLPAFCLPAPDPADGSFCGSSCAANPCPTGYACQDVPIAGGTTARQCVPAGGATCACRDSWSALGLVTTCLVENDLGACEGVRGCGADGLSACEGPAAAAEVCNLLDDDCDGDTDELDPVACETTNAFGACHGLLVCGANSAVACDAPEPAPEACNGLDDDCDGEVDEGGCDDGLACTEDTCASEPAACSHVVAEGFCVIDGACHAAGAISADDACAVCRPELDVRGWSVAADVCSIDGLCYADGATHPGSPCEVCRADVDATAWTFLGEGAKCDDGDPCTYDEICDAEGRCSGPETDNRCADPHACTLDVCNGDGTCSHPPLPGTCFVGGACWNEGQPRPDSPCQICLPTAAAEAWSPASSSAPCDDDDVCTEGDHCDGAGACVGAALGCEDGLDCTVDGCDPDGGCFNLPVDACVIEGACVEALATRGPGEPCVRCDPGVDAYGWSVAPASCFIDGACVAAHTTDPANDCQRCLPAERQDGWSPLSGGACAVPGACLVGGQCAGGVCVDGVDACDDGRSCTVGACNGDGTCTPSIVPGSCFIDGACYDDGVADPEDACRICAAAAADDAWSPNPATCVIDGHCRASGERHPAEPCLMCDPSLDPTGWSPAAAGDACDDGDACSDDDRCDGQGRCVGDTSCDDGLACTTDLCAVGGCMNLTAADACVIDGACRAAGEDPGDACRTCQPAVSQTGWTPAPTSVACDDGSPCSDDDHCNGAGACVGDVSCNDGLFCTNDACTAQGCAHVTDLAWCVIDGTCRAEGDAVAGGCQVCDPDSDQGAWTALEGGAACDDGSPCSVGEACDGQGACVGDTGCDDGVICTVDSCDPVAGCGHDVVDGWCLIGGRCYDDSATTANGCAGCAPAASQTSWTPAPAGLSCDTGDPCSRDATCDGAGQCIGDGSCDDGDPCTIDQCTPSGCDHSQIASDRCVIDGVCYGAGPHVDNPCLACIPSVDQTAWTPRSAATTCNDADPCSSDDHCDGAGHCVGDTSCADGVACTDDVCTAAGCLNPVSAGACYIGGVCREAGADPGNDCRLCDPSASNTEWTMAPVTAACDDLSPCSSDDHCDGMGRCVGDTGCDDGRACTVDRCTASGCDHAEIADGWCRIGGACVAAGPDPDNPCLVCNPAASATAWTPASAATACSDGSPCSTDDHCDGAGKCIGDTSCADSLSCTVDVCTFGGCDNSQVAAGRCLIDGRCVNAGPNPDNPCLVCNPDRDPRAWSPASVATSCDDGSPCSTDDHCDGQGACVGDTSCDDGVVCTRDRCMASGCDNSGLVSGWCRIGGACVSNGATNASNTCERCDSLVSTTSWTPEPSSKACDDNSGCSPTSSCDGAGQCVGDTSCSDGLSCTDDVCWFDLYCINPVATGCLIDGVCRASGATQPGNVCYDCDPGAEGGATGWSLNDGAACTDDSGACTTNDHCSGGQCVGTYVTDSREENDVSSAAWYLGSRKDNMDWPVSFSANLYGPGDEDWFRYDIEDVWTGYARPRVRMSNIPAGQDYDLCIYLRCTESSQAIPTSVDCPSATSSHTAYIGGLSLPGCCSRQAGTATEDIDFGNGGGYECAGSDDDYRAWVRAYRYSGSGWTCSSYSLEWGDD